MNQGNLWQRIVAKHSHRGTGLMGRLAVLLGALASSAAAVAQVTGGTLQYGPLDVGVTPTAIPTLGGAGLVLLSLLLSLAVWRMHRSGSFQGRHLMTVVLTSGALASGLGGLAGVGEAIAQAGWLRDMTSPSGGTLTFETAEAVCVRNATEVPLGNSD